MSTQIRFRRGTTAQHAVFTGALAEVTVDTDKKTAVVHDGGTAGGIPLAREDGKNDGALGFQQDVKTNDYTVLVGDLGKMLVGNKATAINFPLSAAAALTSKFVAGFKNINTGAMTVTPNGAELIDGVNAAITIPTGASVVIKGDGSSFRTYFSNGDVTGNAINNAAALTGANLADNDKLGVFDVSAGSLVSILVSELIAGIFKTARKIANAYFLSSFRLWDATDNTKGLAFNLASIATATTRTITVPDSDITLSNTFTKSYASAQQTITLAGALTLAHGLGVAPTSIAAELVCVTAELGYTAGQVVATNISADANGTGNATGLSIIKDATNLVIRYGALGLAMVNASNGTATQLTPANWKLVLRAFA